MYRLSLIAWYAMYLLVMRKLVIIEHVDSNTFPEVQRGISCALNLEVVSVGRVPSQFGYLVKMVLRFLH